uniref:Ankyrin repeat and SOCS box containing 11 n=1 Tax=Chelydra serpentina TaxID=8475 RepID=A0A8C3SGV3_CHESE
MKKTSPPSCELPGGGKGKPLESSMIYLQMLHLECQSLDYVPVQEFSDFFIGDPFHTGFNVNIVTIDRVSALHEACLGGHVACAKVLLENGAQVNAVTVDGITPLFNACCSGSAACVNMLLEFGATPQLENHLASPIHEAVKRGHRECMEILVANDVDIDHEDSQHGTPLYVACMYQRTDCVKKLLELGASVDLGKRLDTPLHAAVRKSSAEAVNLLTDYGASLTCRNAELKCALDLAAPNSKVGQLLPLLIGHRNESQEISVLFLALPLTAYVRAGKSLRFYVPQFPIY